MDKAILLFKLIPLIIAAMKAIEEAIPGQGVGEQKLAAVRALLEVGYDKTNELWPEISQVIGVLVALFNKTAWK
jgi:hypothetical protein